VSKRRTSSEERRRLKRLGFELEVTPGGDRYWREPETGRRISPTHAAHMLRQEEGRTLREAGWEPVEVEGEKRYWRRPDSGRLYPQGAAYDVVCRQQDSRWEEE
jgi:predicted RNA binding protein YcfA (HicA-like mRNA interferase family)